MRQRIILSAIIFLGCWPGVASAQNIRSNDLMAHCTLSTGPDDYCKGFLNGYSDAASAFQTREMLLTMRATSPPGTLHISVCLIANDRKQEGKTE